MIALLAASLLAPAAQRPLALLDVPFISQSEALCGGAAAAMVLRYWGATGVAAEDFAPLVDGRAGGIDTTALARAVEERGWTALPALGDAHLARAEIDSGRPVIALIEDRPGAFHYVVVVGWHDRAVVLHDPARTPFILMQPAEFERRWSVSGRWMLAVAPGAGRRPNDAGPGRAEPGTVRGPHDPGSCDALVAEGVDRARANELDEAERLLADAAFRCEGAAPLRELAGVRLLQRRWAEVADLAGRAARMAPDDAQAWRLLGASRYVAGDHAAALDAWNRAGEPVIDLVSVSGLRRTRHRAVENVLAMEPGSVLTRNDAERSRRRLSELPAALSTRLEYLPRGGGRTEVLAHVAERTLLPSGRLTWAAIGLRAAASGEVGAGVSSLARGGERLDGRWRFWPNRPAVGLAARLPAGGAGLLLLEATAERQPFSDPSLATAERIGLRAGFSDWATGALRWETHGGLDRWRHGAFGILGGGARLEGGRTTVAATADAWLGDAPFWAGRVRGAWRSSPAPRGTMLVLTAGAEAVHPAAPPDIWPAGDTGQARSTLLRAHPVLHDGALRVERLGRRFAHATAELQRWGRMGHVPLGAAVFADAGRTWKRRGLDSVTDVDVGAGLRLALPGSGARVRLDVSRGLRDGRHAVSVGFEP